MSYRLLLILLVASSSALLWSADKPVPPKDVVSKFVVPAGFSVTLFASEPEVVQPIAFTFDDRGRMWVVECLSYPKWKADGTGRDRVVILEDTNGDGVHDKRTVVIDNGSNLSGIEVGFGGVWLCSTPNFIFVPIKDDKPSGPPQILLDGWNLKEAKHNVFNGLAWGPDGWLYGANGIQTKSNIGKPGTAQKDRTFFDCGVWRYHPTLHTFEIFAVGMTNPWGVDWDDHGELFVTNCVIDHLWHLVPGGHYQRMYGQDANPYAYGHMPSAVDYRHWGGGHWTDARADKATGAVKKEHDTAGGGHAHSGIAIYLGDNFPAEYRNNLFTCNIHGNRLNRDGLVRTLSGMKGVRQPDFAFANDPWFRGVAVKQGPDGALYAADWSDTGECHNYDVADTTNGRLIRIAYGKPKPWTTDINKLTDEELIATLSSKNEWLVRRARRVLQERSLAGKEYHASHFAQGMKDEDPAVKLRHFWALHSVNLMNPFWVQTMLADKSEAVRSWGVRFSTERQEGIIQLTALAKTETSPFVRTAIACAMQKLPVKDRLKVAEALKAKQEDHKDANLSFMLWLGVEPAIGADPEAGLAFLKKTHVEQVRVNGIRRILTLPSSKPTQQLAKILPALRDAKPALQRDILRGVQEAYEGRTDIVAPAGWNAAMTALAQDATLLAQAEAVSVLVGDPKTIETLRTRFNDQNQPTAARILAVQLLVSKKTPGLQTSLQKLLTEAPMRATAIRALAAYPDAQSAAAILGSYAKFTPEEKSDAVQTLASRPAFALKLLDEVEAGHIPKSDINAFTARQILALNNKPISEKLTTVWGTVRPASASRTEQTKRLKDVLSKETLAKADLPNGKKLYTTNCASCHKLFGEGGNVGPELTGSQRVSLDYVLENVLDPSAVVASEYRMVQFTLLDGRSISGIVRKETPQTISVRTLNEELILPVADIDSRKATPLSIMPDGLFDKLSDAEIRDLVGYLASPSQVTAGK
jgi:putative membrane-bound dehydrogenase-like protein